jgi:hypothetical protein
MNAFFRFALLLSALPLALPIVGCSEIDDYFSTVAAEALFLGLDDPAAAEALGLSADLATGASATAFLARARSLSSVSENLFSDADSVSIADGVSSVELLARDNGLYSVDSSENVELGYVVGRSYALEVYDDGRLYSAEMLAPPPPALAGVPDPQAGATHPSQTALELSMGQQFDNYLAVVVDESGTITYSNEPQTAGDYLNWIAGSDTFIDITIPASAFPAPSSGYIVGVAGIRRASDSAFDNFNPLVSNLAMGTLAVSALITAP